MGLTFSDHLQPGSRANREALNSPRVVTSTLPFSKVLVSSGESRLFFWRLSEAMRPHLLPPASPRRGFYAYSYFPLLAYQPRGGPLNIYYRSWTGAFSELPRTHLLGRP